jgi:hypothetical protein
MKTNPELKELQKETHLVVHITWRGLEWLEHMIRMDEIRVAKKIFESKPEGRRKVERCSIKDLKNGENNLREPKVKRRRQRANN